MNKIFFIFLFLFNMLYSNSFELNNSNTTGIYASDSDIIGAYKVLAGKPISPDRFIHCKILKDKNNWKLKNLGEYLISLKEIKNNLDLNWWPIQNKHTLSLPEYNNVQKKMYLKQFLKSDNIKELTYSDIAAAYRVITGQIITAQEFAIYKNLKDNFNIDAKTLAIYIMADRDESQINLNIPLLNSVPTYPITIKNGMTIFGFKSDCSISKTINTYSTWEPHMESLMRKIVNKNDVVIDIGANIGYFSAVLSELVGQNGKVYSFEPISPISDLVTKMKNFNKLDQIQLYNCALSNTDGKAYIKVSTLSPGISKFTTLDDAIKQNKRRPNSVIEVPCYALDNILLSEKINKLDYIKIDVEGAEPLVFSGAKKIIQKFLPKITWEFNLVPYKKQGLKPLNLLKEFEILGYKFAVVTELLNIQDPESLTHGNWLNAEKMLSYMETQHMIQLDIFLKHFPK